jgi:hypothetical protein
MQGHNIGNVLQLDFIYPIFVLIIFYYIAFHNIMLTYIHIKPQNFMKGESLLLN